MDRYSLADLLCGSEGPATAKLLGLFPPSISVEKSSGAIALPLIDPARQVLGMVLDDDLMVSADLDAYDGLRE